MSLVHALSSEAVTSALDIFTVPPTLGLVESGQWVEYTPISAYTGNTGPVEFQISGNTENYLDLANSYLHLRVKITTSDGGDIPEAAKVGPVNLLLHSVFQTCDVFLNDRQVSSTSSTYAYKAYLETLLSYDNQAKKSHLNSALWFEDDAGKMDAFDNSGLGKRGESTKKSKTVDLFGRVHSDIFHQEKYILNGVDMRVKLVRSKPEFSLMNDDAENYAVSIQGISLYVRQVVPSPSLVLAHAKALEKGNAKYPFKKCEVKTISVAQGMSSLNQDHLFLGALPKRIVLGCVGNQAFNGDYKKNPFNFHHYNLNYLCLYLNGKQVPLKALQPNFATEEYVQAYMTLFSGSGMLFDNRTNGITRYAYGRGFTLYAFDLSPTLEEGDFFNVQREGNLRLEMKFAKALPESVNVIIYSEHESVLETDRARNVYIDQ